MADQQVGLSTESLQDQVVGSGRRSKSDLLWLAVIGLLVQGFWLLYADQPGSMDAYYYSLNGQRLAGGSGFTEPIIWQFLDEPAGLPAPSHSYWQPFASLLAALGYSLSDNFRAAQAPFWLLTSLLPLLSYAISRQMGGARWQAITAALFTASGGFYAVFWNQPETFAPFAWAGAVCLFALAQVRTRRGPAVWLVAGLAAGVAHLTRADGLLLLLLALAIWVWEWLNSRPKGAGAPLFSAPISLLVLLLGYFLVMGGWFLRNWLVLGQLLPAVGTETIFLTTYDDLFAYGRSFGPAGFLEWGLDNILRTRLRGAWLALQSFIAISGLIFLIPFILSGWIGNYRERPVFIRPFTGYTFLLFTVMSLVFTFPGVRGGLFHSSAAIWPWTMALAADGIGRTIDWLAIHRPRRRPERDRRIYPAMFVMVAFVISLSVGLTRPSEGTDGERYEAIGALLPATAVVMVGNAPAFHYHTGLAAVSVPNEPLPVLLEVAARYGAGYLILDENHPRPLADFYAGRESSSQVRLIETFDTARLYQFTTLQVDN